MALKLSHKSAVASSRPAAPSRRMVVPRAGLFSDFLSIFSKPNVDNSVPWQQGASGFTGNIAHHGGGRPFKDGFVGKGAASSGVSAPEAGGNQAVGYVAEAVERVVAHNFTGDENEPPTNTGAEGWKGDLHDRKTDGFHARKL